MSRFRRHDKETPERKQSRAVWSLRISRAEAFAVFQQKLLARVIVQPLEHWSETSRFDPFENRVVAGQLLQVFRFPDINRFRPIGEEIVEG